MEPDLRGARTGEPLEQRIARIEDTEAIKALWFEYAWRADTSTDGHSVTQLHSEDAIWEGTGAGGLGIYEGREQIEPFITAFYQSCVWKSHHMTNVVVEVADGGTFAKGRCCLVDFVSLRPQPGDEPVAAFLSGGYDIDFVKRDGRWWIKHVRLHIHQISRWEQGWVRDPDMTATG